MTSITSSTSAGLSMMDTRIDRAASAGKISATDQAAMESALSNIASELSSSSTTATTSGGTMQDKVSSLIQGQVSSGTLTSDQATELQGFFAHGAHAAHGHHGGHGGGGAIEALLGSSDSTASSDAIDGSTDTADGATSLGTSSDGSTASIATSTSASTEQQQLGSLISFLQNLRSSITSGTYGGSTVNSSSNTGALIDAAA